MSDQLTSSLVPTGIALLVAILGLLTELARRKLTNILRHAEAARYQVQNSHTTNLRDDLDRVLAAVESNSVITAEVLTTLNAHSRELEGIRDDLRVERVERVAGDKAAVAALTVIHNAQ